MSSQKIVHTTAHGRVATMPNGTASIQLSAHVPSSQATPQVYINMTSGTASAKVTAQEPSSKRLAAETSVHKDWMNVNSPDCWLLSNVSCQSIGYNLCKTVRYYVM